MAELLTQQHDFQVGQTVSWEDADGMHYGRISFRALNGAMVYVNELSTHMGHRVGADRLTLVKGDGAPKARPSSASLVDLPMLAEIPLAQIRPCRWQPRSAVFDADALMELAASIRDLGLANPITVFSLENAGEGTGYELVAGERRVRASIALVMARLFPNRDLREWVGRLAAVGIAGIGEEEVRALRESCGSRIRANIEYPDLPRLHKIAVIENIQRADLTLLEEAHAFKRLMDDMGWSQRRLADEIGMSQGYVSQRLQLLGLPTAAQNALADGTLGLAQARAIAGTPEPVRWAITEWATKTTDDGHQTSRQVADMSRALAAFVDPERWVVPEERVVLPQTRNYVALVRWAVEHSDIAANAQKLIALGTGTLTQACYTILECEFHASRVLEALIGEDLETAWETFAVATGRRCETCALNNHAIDLAGMVISGLPCARWSNPDVAVCPKWIGANDPAVMRVRWPVDTWMKENGMEANLLRVVGSNFAATDIASYMRAISGAIEDYKARHENPGPREPLYIADIRIYWEWQQAMPAEDLAHVQAHACRKCRQYQPLQVGEGLPPCGFAREGLNGHALKFGALADSGGRLLPRCDMFQYRELPSLAIDRYPEDTRLPESSCMHWLEAVGRNGHSAHGAVWSVLAWLPYDRASEAADWKTLSGWIRHNWDQIGEDRGMALLLDVAQSEATWRDYVGYSGQKPRDLMNCETGETETWLGITVQEVARGTVNSLPSGWKDPFKVWRKTASSRS